MKKCWCLFPLFELLSLISVTRYQNFLTFSLCGESVGFTLLFLTVLLSVFSSVLFWPTYITVTSAKLLSPWQREVWEEACAHLKHSMFLSLYGGPSLQMPTEIRTHVSIMANSKACLWKPRQICSQSVLTQTQTMPLLSQGEDTRGEKVSDV